MPSSSHGENENNFGGRDWHIEELWGEDGVTFWEKVAGPYETKSDAEVAMDELQKKAWLAIGRSVDLRVKSYETVSDRGGD